MHMLVCVSPEWTGVWGHQLRLCLESIAKLHCVLAPHFVPSVAGHQPPSELAAVCYHSQLVCAPTQAALLAVVAQQAAGRLAHPLQPQTVALDGRRVAAGVLALQEPAAASAAPAVDEATWLAWLHGASGPQCGAPAHPSPSATTQQLACSRGTGHHLTSYCI